ncbi:F-box only protein 15-like isoform X1 [Phycodurus eques]|uniref:F-box only protein 15-like isoform X1 n=2 Tax=Phycodurus eques TaxID=693459 RepID=UPI002ACEE6DA|nr:F-box only protein 15-like isoform X1 [Phycodurus eques]
MASGREKFLPRLLEGQQPEPDWWLPGGPISQPIGRANDRHQETRRNEARECLTQVDSFKTLLKLALERLPPEILMKILSHLDAASLLSLCQVNKLFCRLANDDATWYKIYMAHFAWELWRPKATEDGADRATEPQERPPGGWKERYLWKMGGQELSKWQRETRNFDPLTGLPQHLGRILRNINVVWEVTLRDGLGREATPPLSAVSIFKTSVTFSWGGSLLVRHPHVCAIRLSAVRKDAHGEPKTAWRSLICRTDAEADGRPRGHFLGKDRLVQIMFFPPGFIVGFWRGQKSVAFVTVSLHLDKLLERTLLGSPVCCYWQPEERRCADLGTRTYTLHFGLHDTTSDIMSAYFNPLYCRPVGGRCLAELRPIDRGDVSQHRLLSGNIRLLWKSDSLEGSLENCCVMTLTVLEVYTPLWCVSVPVCVRTAGKPQKSFSDNYSDGEHFLLVHKDARGLVKMTLVWLKEQRQVFVVDLAVSVFKNEGARY